MIQKKKNLKFRKISEKVKKLGGTITASNAQLERLFNEQHIKYVMCLEDQLQEDNAHLLLKQDTIEILQEDIKLKNRKIEKLKIDPDNEKYLQFSEKLKDFIKGQNAYDKETKAGKYSNYSS